MIRLIRFVSSRHFLQHRLRTMLTFLGIALGVAAIVAIAVVNRTLMSSFQRTIDLIAGKAVLQVTNGESGVRESLFPLIRDSAGVKDAAPSVEGFLPMVGLKGEKLFVYGVDLLTDSAMREHRFVGGSFDLEGALDFIAQPDSIGLTESLSRRLGLSLGSKVNLATSRGVQSYTVGALLKEEGAAKAFGGSFALMDLPVAQIALGKEGRLDVVDLTIEEGEEIETVRQRIEQRLDGSAQVERPQKRGEQIELLLTSYRVGLFFVSLVALFVGCFLIYNAVSVSVVQRKREIGTLRCLGMRRRNILMLFLAEALALSFLASLAGVWFGLMLAKAAILYVAQTVSTLFLQIDPVAARLGLREFLVAIASGVGVSALAALYPSWQATQVTPLEGYRQAPWRPRSKGAFRATIVGLLLILISPLIWLFSPQSLAGVEKFTLGVVAILVFLLGLCFLSPLLILAWVKFSQGRIFWLEGRLASDSLGRNPVRSGITVSTLMISLAAIFTIATFVNSVRGSLLSWVDRMVTADLIVHSGAKTAGPLNVPLKEDLAEEFRLIPGVQIVDLYRLIRSTYEGKPILIESFSAQASANVRNLPMVEGEGAEALKRMALGEGVIVSESFQSRFGKGLGATVHLPTPSGLRPFTVLGVYVDYSADTGSILIDRSLYKKVWQDELVDAFDLWLAPGTDQRAVIRKIRDDYGEKYQLFISTHKELREHVVEIMQQSFTVNYAVEIVAVIVAIFSVIHSLLASILDRTREIGVLRAIGATRRQLQVMAVAEAGWMGLLGGLLGIFAGTVMSYHHVVYNTKALTGWTFQYHYPFGVAFLSILAAIALCLLAGFFPAKQAASTNIVSAIGYE
jgi:putative ABC transport system permease protein